MSDMGDFHRDVRRHKGQAHERFLRRNIEQLEKEAPRGYLVDRKNNDTHWIIRRTPEVPDGKPGPVVLHFYPTRGKIVVPGRNHYDACHAAGREYFSLLEALDYADRIGLNADKAREENQSE